MAIAYVRDTGKVRVENGNTSAMSFGALPAVNNHVFACQTTWNNARPTSITFSDNQTNSWATDATREDTLVGGSGARTAIGSAKVATSSGTFTVTGAPNTTSGNYSESVAAEFSGLDTTTHLDKTGTGQWAAAANAATVTASAANSQNDVLVLVSLNLDEADANLNIGTPTTGYTRLAVNHDSVTTIGFDASYKIVSAAETSSAAWTHDSARGSAALATYKAAAGGGGTARFTGTTLSLGRFTHRPGLIRAYRPPIVRPKLILPRRAA